MLHRLPQFKHDNSTYRGARLIHWLALKRDAAGLRKRQEGLGQARDLTCTREDGNGHTTEVRDRSIVFSTVTSKVLALTLALDMDTFGHGWEGQTQMVIMLLGN